MSKVLVVVDMQNDFITGPLGTKEAQAIVDPIYNFIKEFSKDKDSSIIFTQDTHYKDSDDKVNYEDSQEGKKLPIEHCIYGTDGWNINDKLLDFNYSKIIEKIEKETFGSTALGKFCLKAGYPEIHFVGVCTDICVISNALLVKAFDPEAKIIVHKDLCAGVTPESHEIALKAMEACQIEIV